MLHDLDGILAQMDVLAGIDTDGVEPMAQVLYDASENGENPTLRADIERPSLDNEVALQNAPVSGEGYFKVPRVIER